MRGLSLALAMACACALAHADGQRLEGTVTRVSDGDTLWLRIEGEEPASKPVKLRLEGIDAPERCQPWGSQSAQALTGRVLGRKVQVVLRAQDAYRRWLGSLWLDGDDVSAWMVSEGHAWSYRFRRSDGPYARQEREARVRHRGLFSQPDPMQPQVFRRWHGPCRPAATAAS
ncbi:thermonuclease family protein [Schlegelella sp. S2-27]|uniref:Thermonuclease family protein n=1 Tax=Caldimonas mangrovi TaxID=2944811 RepID=A0ABT0YTY4_9BURK|nr:thermonuclease family protein [Caldimonas mangrovi]MCM5681303.1 thermonuclease family protein [Caldimonas mangrovi]